MTSLFDLIGLVAAALTTFAFLPQVIQTWRSRSAAGLNFAMLLVLATGVFLWLVYGIGAGQLPVILANGATRTRADPALLQDAGSSAARPSGALTAARAASAAAACTSSPNPSADVM